MVFALSNQILQRIEFTRRIQILIFGLAVLVRLILVHFFSRDPVNDLLWNDAVGWNLAQGNGYTASQSEPYIPGVFRTPGYPVFLAILYSIFGHSYSAVYIVQAFLDAGSALLIGRIALYYFTPFTSIASSFLYAIYPYPGMFCGSLHLDILLVFCVLWTLLLTTRALKIPNYSRWMWVGVMLGITALVKPNFLLFSILPVALILFFLRERRIARIATVLAMMMLVLLPWFVRNYVVFNSFPPLSVGNTGTNARYLVVELNQGAEAVREIGLGPPRTKAGGFTDGHELIRQEKELARSSLKELTNRWPEYTVLMIKHIPRLWITKTPRWHGQTVGLLGGILSWMVLLGGIAGMLLVAKNWKRLLPLYLHVFLITLMYMPYTIEARYTLPARPVMLCFVAAALVVLLQKSRGAPLPSPES